MNTTIVNKKRSFLKDQSKEDFLNKLKVILKGKVLKAYIFGSFLTEDFHADSDLDLILVVETTTPFVERVLNFPEILELDAPIDLLVYTPSEFEKISQEPKVGFWKTAFSQLQQIL